MGDSWGNDGGGWGDSAPKDNSSSPIGWGDNQAKSGSSGADGGWGDEPKSSAGSNSGGGWGDEPKSTGGGGWGDTNTNGSSSGGWGSSDGGGGGFGGGGYRGGRGQGGGGRGRGRGRGGFHDGDRGREDFESGFRGRGRGRGNNHSGFGRRDNESSGGDWGDTSSANNNSSGGGGWGDNSSANTRNDSSSGGGGGWGDSGSDNKRQDNNSGGGGWGDNDSGNKRHDNNSGGGGWGDSGSGNKRQDNNSGGGGGWGDGGSSGARGDHTTSGENNEERPAPYRPEDLNLEEEAMLHGDKAGENFHRYKEQKVTCIPLDIVKPIEKFSDVIESKLLLGNLKSLGYSEMTPIQRWAMPAILQGNDIIGCAQTGSGKTAAFLLPILQTILKTDLESHDPNSDCQNPYCLIISPTRELAKQLYAHCEMLAKDSILKCHFIYGQIATSHLKSKISTGCHVLVATPGKLKDFLDKGWIGFKNIKYVVLDEGDRLIDESFMGDIRTFINHESMPSKEDRQTLLFSATFKQEIQNNAKEFLKESFVFLAVGRVGAANEDIKQEFLQVARSDKKRELKNILKSIPETDKAIIFTQTKTGADMLAGFFTSLDLSSTSIHGDRHQSQREQAITSFRRGEKRFLISSPVGNRGLDLPKVSLVINYDLPTCVDEYVHRIGRTGRAGHTGKAISFYDAERDTELVPALLKILEEAKQEIPDFLRDVPQVAAYADEFAFMSNNTDTANKREADDMAGNSPKRSNMAETAQPVVEEEW